MKKLSLDFGLMALFVPLLAVWIPCYSAENTPRTRNDQATGLAGVEQELPRSNPRSRILVGGNQVMLMEADQSNVRLPESVQQRLTNGHFVLQYEMPEARRSLNRHVEGVVAKYQKRIDEDYDQVFKQFSFSTATVDKLKSHLACIERARAEAEAYLIQLDHTKVAYDRQIRELLKPEQYRSYRELEASRSAVRECLVLKEYLHLNGFPLQSADDGQLLLKALTTSSLVSQPDGPYGIGARASGIPEQIVAFMVEDLQSVLGQHVKVLHNLSRCGVSKGACSKVNEYFVNREQAMLKQVLTAGTQLP